MTSLLIISFLTGILVTLTIIPFLRIPLGLVRICGFPRLQVATVSAALVPITVWAVDIATWFALLVFTQLVVAGVQAVYVVKFTPLWACQSKRFEGSPDDDNIVSILSANVKMSNRDYERTLDAVRMIDPDILIFLETDEGWANALRALKTDWPEVAGKPLDNTYGMLLFSRYTLIDSKVESLVLPDVPSIHTTVELPDGSRFKLFAIHPEPPVPYAKTVGRDAELIVIAERVLQEELPAVVTGDLNDVAWSHTTRRFQRLSQLLDPRVGRGLYNTFDARFPLLRWPLDHLFHDPRFELVDMGCGPDINSDHFPIYFKLALSNDDRELGYRQDSAKSSDQHEALEVKREAKNLDRGAIGTDWED